jgi:ABC-2 type transport system permease protein
MNAFAYHFGFEFKTGLRNSNLLMINYLFPIGFYLAMGLVMTRINPPFREALVPAMALFAILTSTILGMPGPLVEAREAGVFRSFKINGVPPLSILLVPALTTIFHGMIAALLVAFTAPLLFDGAAPQSWPALVAVLIVTAFACGGIGALISVVSTNNRATVLWSQLIFLPTMLLGGLMVPLNVLPPSILPLSGLLPTTYAMQAIQSLAYRQPTVIAPWAALGVLAACAVLSFGMATYLFNWDTRNASRRGHPAMALIAWIPFVAAALAMI